MRFDYYTMEAMFYLLLSFHNGVIYLYNYQSGAFFFKIPTKGKSCQNGTISQ